jgi:hypothetical protein
VKNLLGLFFVLLTAPAFASQEWELISVKRGGTWEVNEARGLLKQNQKILEGVLKDKTDGKADYRIHIEPAGEQAQATFFSENDEGAKLTGTYKKAAMCSSGRSGQHHRAIDSSSHLMCVSYAIYRLKAALTPSFLSTTQAFC